MSCKFILAVNLMSIMSCPQPSCSHFQFNKLVLSNFRLMCNVTVLYYATCSMNVIVQCIFLYEIVYLIVDYYSL